MRPKEKIPTARLGCRAEISRDRLFRWKRSEAHFGINSPAKLPVSVRPLTKSTPLVSAFQSTWENPEYMTGPRRPLYDGTDNFQDGKNWDWNKRNRNKGRGTDGRRAVSLSANQGKPGNEPGHNQPRLHSGRRNSEGRIVQRSGSPGRPAANRPRQLEQQLTSVRCSTGNRPRPLWVQKKQAFL